MKAINIRGLTSLFFPSFHFHLLYLSVTALQKENVFTSIDKGEIEQVGKRNHGFAVNGEYGVATACSCLVCFALT